MRVTNRQHTCVGATEMVEPQFPVAPTNGVEVDSY